MDLTFIPAQWDLFISGLRKPRILGSVISITCLLSIYGAIKKKTAQKGKVSYFLVPIISSSFFFSFFCSNAHNFFCLFGYKMPIISLSHIFRASFYFVISKICKISQIVIEFWHVRHLTHGIFKKYYFSHSHSAFSYT